MKIGVSLPVREMGSDISAIRAFAQLAEEIALAKSGQLDHLAVNTLLQDRHLTGEDDVHADAHVPLRDDCLIGAEAASMENAAEALAHLAGGLQERTLRRDRWAGHHQLD